MRPILTRRDFLQRAALTSAVLASARPAAAADGLPAPAGGNMFVSLNGSVTRGVSGLDKARLAAKVGYGGVDWDLGPAKAAGLDATKSLFAELKIKPSITGFPMARPLPFGGEQAAFQQALGPLAEDAAFAAASDFEMMVVLSRRPRPRRAAQGRQTSGCAPGPARSNPAGVDSGGAVSRGPRRRTSPQPVHLDASRNRRARQRQRSEHRCRPGRLALASFGRHDRRYPRSGEGADRSHPRLRREGAAAGRGSRQSTPHAR